jgi:hypothetical protein
MKDVRHDSLQEIPFYRSSRINYHVQRRLLKVLAMKRNPIQNSNYILLINIFIFHSNQYGAVQSVVTGTYAGRSGVHILAEVRKLPILQNTQSSSSSPSFERNDNKRLFLQ